MKVDTFQQLLRDEGHYETSPQARSACDHAFGWMDMWYYIKLLNVIHACHRCAIKGEFNRENWSCLSHRILQAIESCGGIIEISGTDNLKKLNEKPAVYISNHMSMVETFILPSIVLTYNKYMSTVLKKSLMKYPVFKNVLEGFDAITVGRENPRDDLRTVMTKGTELLNRGWAICIFPQSTRSTVVKPEDFNTLGIKLARKANVPVVPLALKTDFLAPGRIIRDFGRLDRKKKIYLKFGEPINVDGNSKEAHNQVVNYITETLANSFQ